MTQALTKDNPLRSQRDATITEMRLEGKSMKEIADYFDINKSTVCRVLKDETIKEVLEAGTQEMIMSVPKAIDNMQNFLKSKDQRIKFKASEKILEITGIAPGKINNTYIANIYQQNNTQIVDPTVMKAMAHFIDEAEVVE